jgi:hypothetical protein
MACARSRVLLNPAERRVLDELRDLTGLRGAEVWCKVGLKDAVDLNNSGITNEQYSYAMRAHLDFVVTERSSSRILFAVEYDGAEHFTDADTIQRDRKKSDVCRTLGFDLLRVTKCQLESVFLGRNQLQLLVERWFSEHEEVQAAPILAVVGR